jgi:two-component system, response regulator RegA
MNSDPPRLLILEDNERFAEALTAEFCDRSYEVLTARNLAELSEICGDSIDFAIVDLRLRGDDGLDAITIIKENNPHAKVVVLTGYGSIATAVQATKRGADNYLTKPVDIDKIEHAFGVGKDAGSETTIREESPSLARHEREYIEYVLAECNGNISKAARRLGLHRQSLQRKLRKHTPR